MKCGVPFDVASSLDAEERLAWCVAYGEMEGGEYDWEALEWVKRDA